MKGLKLGLSLVGSSAPFSPSSISPQAWYDPSDLSTLWKDTGGTIPVAADGDAVARMDDKSGNGHHVTQATAANCPLYKTDGTHSWLLFDGTNDTLFRASVPITDASGSHANVSGIRLASTTGFQSVVDADSAARISQLIRVNSGTPESIAFNAAVSAFTDSCAAISTTDIVLSEQTASAAVEIFKDGVGNGSTAITGTMESGSTTFSIGSTNASSQFLNGRFYGSVHLARAFAGSEHSKLVTWMGAKQGRTI